MEPAITVVIPVREGGNPSITLRSLAHQNVPLNIVVSWDHGRGANVARNNGFSLVKTPFVLFSDDDITWRPGALSHMLMTLMMNPQASYCYGAYDLENWIQCNVPWNAPRLLMSNYISTMSLIRTDDFPLFDPDIKRLQDWELWVRMYKDHGKTGVYCGRVIFSTKRRAGITYGANITHEEAVAVIRKKHNI